jgi:hypothetical protein
VNTDDGFADGEGDSMACVGDGEAAGMAVEDERPEHPDSRSKADRSKGPTRLTDAANSPAPEQDLCGQWVVVRPPTTVIGRCRWSSR